MSNIAVIGTGSVIDLRAGLIRTAEYFASRS